MSPRRVNDRARGSPFAERTTTIDTTTLHVCLVCGAEFYVKPHRAKNPDAGKYCSFACKNRARKRPAEERFWEHVDRSGGPDACWPWTAARDADGYGLFTVEAGKQVVAHRFAYALAHGEIDRRIQVLHRCDNPPCCNDAHLVDGTNADNMADMARKGRARNGWNIGRLGTPRGTITPV